MTAPTDSLTDILRRLRQEADEARSQQHSVYQSFEEYRWQLDHAFTGYAPRAGEFELYIEMATPASRY